MQKHNRKKSATTIKSIDRNVVLLGWVSFFTDMASAMITPLLPIFVVSVLHEGMDKLGIVVAVATFVSYALRFVSGYLSDRFGVVKPLVVGGYLLSAIAKPTVGLTHGYKSVAALRALERLGKALRSAPKDVMIAHYATSASSGKTFGFHKTMDIAGELSGMVAVFALLYLLGESEGVIRGIFLATLLPGMIGVAIVAFGVRDVAPRKNGASDKIFRLTTRDKRHIASMLWYFAFLFFFFSDAFFAVQAKETGVSVTYLPLLFALSAGVQTATSYLFGVSVDRFGARAVMSVAYLCGIAAQGLLWTQQSVATWIAFALMGLFTVASLNAQRADISRSCDNKGSVYGIFYAGVALAAASGAYVIGRIWESGGMEAALRFSSVGTMIVGTGYCLWYGIKPVLFGNKYNNDR